MKPLQRLLINLLVTTASGLGLAAAAEPAQDFAAIEQAVRQAMPSTHIDAIAPSPIPGLVEVVAGQNVLYADTSGRWLLVGHLYDLTTARDVTADRKAQLSRLDWHSLPLAAAVHYGEGPLRLAIFSDPDCPWCRKLNQALRFAQGIEVWEIMFPVPALHPAARDKAVDILCHARPAEALAHTMDGKAMPGEPPAADCIGQAQQRVEQAMAFGRANGIQGTPTLVAPDGRVHNGYLPLDQLKAWLEQDATRAGPEAVE
ncbi:MAG: DsbC family protein [Wenzhouxiangellaceae bacterium]